MIKKNKNAIILMIFALFFGFLSAGAASAANVPTANFTSNVINGTSPLSVQFNDISTGNPTSWIWYFGDSLNSTEQNPVHNYSTAGTYNVSLTAINAVGNNTITKTVYTAPVANFETSTMACEAPLSVTFTDLSTGNITSWYWEFGDGGNSTEQNPTYIYQIPGLYSVTETVTGPGGSNTLVMSGDINIPDTIPPVAKSNLSSGLYNSTQTIRLTATDVVDPDPSIYYTLNGQNPTRNLMPAGEMAYTGPITISNQGTTILKFIAVDSAGNVSNMIIENITIDTVIPTATANLDTGLYNTNKVVELSMSKNGTIYYTTNGQNPTTNSTKYTGPIDIISTTNLKFIAVDLAGNKSSVYSQTYTIDKIPPKVLSTSPKNLAQGISRTATIAIKFSENIKLGIDWSKIYVKDLNTGKITKINKINNGRILIIETGIKSANNWYQIYIPAAAVKDNAGNNNTIATFKYKTN